MFNYNIMHKLKLKLRSLNSEDGFSLIELLVAMLLLLLIVLAFTPLLTGSIMQISYAGDKTEALYEGQSEMEVSIAERKTQYGNILEFTFPDNPEVTIEVPGELVSVDVDKGNASAWLSGFIPYLPHIRLTNPPLIIEGYENNLLVTVEGRHTDFENAEKIMIYEEKDDSVSKSYSLNITYTDSLANREIATFELEKGLKVSNNPYIAAISWDVDDFEITVTTRFYVHYPGIVAVGEGQRIWVSPSTGSTWQEREYQKSGTGSLNDVTWTSLSTCIAVSDNGRTIVWDMNSDPRISESRSGITLNAVLHGGGRYFGVGSGGQAVISDNEEGFIINAASIVDAAEGNSLNDIDWDGQHYVAVGSNGTIIRYNGNAWENISPDIIKYQDDASRNIELNSISFGSGSSIVIAGNHNGEAAIFYFEGNNGSWTEVGVDDLPVGTDILNGIIYDGDHYIAVGNNGTVIYSPNGTDWHDISIVTSNDFYAVDFGNIIEESTDHGYIIVGQNGAIYTGSKEINSEINSIVWEQQVGISSGINGVAVR